MVSGHGPRENSAETFDSHLHIKLKRIYSRVPNKRGVRIIGGLDMVRYNNNRGVEIIGGGCLKKLKTVLFLGKYVSFIYSCEQ